MIGKQLRVYLHPRDHAAVEVFLREGLQCALVESRWQTPSAQEVDSSPGVRPWVFVTPLALRDSLQPGYIQSQGYWLLDPAQDPVIEWWYSKLDTEGLYPGRFYYIPRNVSSDGGEKDARFLAVAQELFKWLRKFTVRVPTDWGVERLGPEAAELFANGRLILRQGPPGSTI